MKKLEILTFYGVFISIVTLFWAIVFKLICPHLIIQGVIIVAITTSIISAVLITKCFIEIDKEKELVAKSVRNNYSDL